MTPVGSTRIFFTLSEYACVTNRKTSYSLCFVFVGCLVVSFVFSFCSCFLVVVVVVVVVVYCQFAGQCVDPHFDVKQDLQIVTITQS